MTLSLELMRSASAFAGIRGEWDRLAERFRTPLLSHDWLFSCAEAFAREEQLRILLVRRNGALAAAAPLVQARTGPFSRLEMLGASALYEPTGFLYDSDESLHALCNAVVDVGLPLWLQRIPGDAPLATTLAASANGHGWLMSSSGGECPRVASGIGWDAYLGSRSAQRRYDLRRARRRLDSQGTVEFLCHRPTIEELGPLLESAVAVEASGWKGTAGSALARRPDLSQFFTRYASRASESGQLRISFLSVGGTPAATEVAIEAYGAYWVLKIGYDDRWAHASPGLVLMTECMRMAMLEGLGPHEFLGTAERWILAWSTDCRRYVNLRYYPSNWRAAPAAAMDQAARVAAKIRSVVARNRRRNATRPSEPSG